MADSYAHFTVRGADSADEVDEISEELEALRGVQMAEIDRESGHVEVRYGEELLSEERIEDAVRDAGYEVE